mgnify:CR=1 FL=1
MNATNAKFTVGQPVKMIMRRGRSLPATVTKVYRDGTVAVALYPSSNPYLTHFNTDGHARGRHNYDRIESLAEGETLETLAERNRQEDQARRDAANAANAEKAKKVAEWWEATGRVIWATRVVLPGDFLGHQVSVIRYTKHGEQYMPMVIERIERIETMVDQRKYVRLTIGGLNGRVWTTDDGDHTTLNTYSQSECVAPTIEEALYDAIA